MKAILEFDLNSPEDRDEFKRVQLAYELSRVISEFSNDSLRKRIKYDTEISEKEYKLLETLKTELWALVNEHGCSEVVE